jgi:PAS domain S-box-containing protein
MEARLPSDEAARLETLRKYCVLDTPSESDFDDLVKLAAEICETPISLVSLVDEKRQWFKGRYGLEVTETPRKLSFCAHTILNSPKTMVVQDALQDPRFNDNELVTGPLGIRAYAGAPLVSPEGHALGTLCVIDKRPREFTPAQKNALRVLGRQVQVQLELKRTLAELGRRYLTEQARLEKIVGERTAELTRANMESQVQKDRFKTLAQASFEGILLTEDGRIVDCNEQITQVLGFSREELIGQNVLELLPVEQHDAVTEAIRGQRDSELELHFRHKDASQRITEVRGRPLKDNPALRVVTVRDVTAQREAQRALTTSEEQLSGIVASAMDAIISTDEHQRICLFNPAAENLFGLSAAEALGEHINRLIPERFRAGHVSHVDQFGTSGSTSRRMGALGMLTGLRANGEEFPIEASISQVNVQGQKLFTVILRDVTERYNAEHALRDREERLSLVIDAAKLGTWDWNLITNELYWSERTLEHFGLPPDTTISYERFRQAVHPEDRGWVAEAVRSAIENRSDYDVEMRAVWPDGSEHWIASRGRAYYDGERPVRMSGATMDITERRQAQEQARRWEQVFEEADFGLVYANAATNTFIAVNPSFARQRGYTPEELANKPILTVYPPELREELRGKFTKIDRAGHLVFESVHLRKDGSRFPVLMEVTTVRDANGLPVSRMAYALDITELVAARESLARSHEELERQVAERTAQLVEANANLQNFSHMAAHDLRSPLRAISSFTSIIAEEYGPQLGSAGQSMVQRVMHAAGQMSHLLNDLLEYSRISQAELQLKPIDTEVAVREAVGMLHQDISARHAEVAVGEPLPQIIGHRATVVLIVANLLSNGLKFMPEGRVPQLKVWAEPVGACLRLQVEDNGIGIAAGDLQRVFGAFERVHGKGKYPGTGLGLAIVKKAAERMGGHVGVESTLGQGSRFWVELPLAHAHQEGG